MFKLQKKVAKSCHIYTMLHGQKKKHLSFHTPGHKQGGLDITELSYSDNLRSPGGCILRAEEDIASILGAKKSFLLTDGSTSGVLAMLYAAKQTGVNSIATADNAHESFFHGCALLGLTPLVYPTGRKSGVPYVLPFAESLNAFPALFERADALFVTSPTYYGQVAELATLRDYCVREHKLLLCDGAHGGHLHFNKEYHAGSFAALWVDGVHKSLPALTQGAVVSTGREELVPYLRSGVEHFRTSSPSYPIMASVEYALRYPANRKLESAVRAFAKATPRAVLLEDWTKLCIRFGKNAFAVQAELEKRGIYAEFCDGNLLLFYLSSATGMHEWKTLVRVLRGMLKKYPYEEEKGVERNHAPLLLNPNAKKEWVDLERSVGRICGRNCGLFPPCTPLLFEGQRIEKADVEKLLLAPNTYGLNENKIVVYEDESCKVEEN